MQPSDWVTIVTTATTVLSVVVAGYALWRQLTVLKKQMAIQHFAEYARRHAELMARLPERVHDAGSGLDALGERDVVMPIMRTFFATCFEEWYLHERGYFDPGMWGLWRRAMHDALAKQAFREAWERIALDTRYGPEFNAFVANEMARSGATPS